MTLVQSFIISFVIYGLLSRMLRAAFELVYSSLWARNNQQDEDILEAVSRTKESIEETGQGLRELLTSIESVKNEDEIELGFDKVNNIFRSFLTVFPGRRGFRNVREAIKSLGVSSNFTEHLTRSSKLEEAILGWKIFVLQTSWTRLNKKEAEDKRMKKEDAELIKRFFPKSKAGGKLRANNHGNKRRKLNEGSQRTVFTAKQFSTMKRKGICFFFRMAIVIKEKHVSLNI